MSEARTKQKRGFAAMSPEKQREIARKGGRAAHEAGTAHQFSTEEARLAGKKGGRRRKNPGGEAAGAFTNQDDQQTTTV